MSSGKLAAQAGHAYTNTLLCALEKDPEMVKQYETYGNIGTKVCLKSKNLIQLELAYEQARIMNIPCSLIVDQGHVMLPDFTGEPIVTALGLGPIDKETAKKLTKKFRMMK